jgi:hypothetical protein
VTDAKDRPNSHEESSMVGTCYEATVISDPATELCGSKMELPPLELQNSTILAGEGAPAGEVREPGTDENPTGNAEDKNH